MPLISIALTVTAQFDANNNNNSIYNFWKIFITKKNTSSRVFFHIQVQLLIVRIALCVSTDYACVHACMPIRSLYMQLSIHHYYMCVRVHDTRIHLHTHTHTRTCRQTQAFNPPCMCDTHVHTHTSAYTRTNMNRRTHTLTRLLEKGVRIWEGMVLCIRPRLAIGILPGVV